LASIDPETRDAGVIALLADVMGAAGLRCALIGGHAVNAWAEPRYTKDFDLVVMADAPAVSAVMSRLVEEGFSVTRLQEPNAGSGPDFIRLERGDRPDIVEFQAAKTDYQELIIERAIQLTGARLPVATPEDLLVLKLIANRVKDQDDMFRLSQQDGIDWQYVEHWAAIWDVSNSLENLRRIIASGSL
jgi:hypothetical protein